MQYIIGSSYSNPRYYYSDIEKNESDFLKINQTFLGTYFSITVRSGGYLTITRTTNNTGVRIFVLICKAGGNEYDYSELNNLNDQYIQNIDGAITVIAI